MLVVDLHCAHGHRFEGWFASAEGLTSQRDRGLLACPVCGSHDVTRRPSAPRLNTSHLKERPSAAARHATAAARGQAEGAAATPAAAMAPQRQAHGQSEAARDIVENLQALYLQAVRHVVANTEDVGERFAEEVRSIHHGDAPERAIRGQASEEEKQALKDEGIEVLSLAIPDAVKGTLQ